MGRLGAAAALAVARCSLCFALIILTAGHHSAWGQFGPSSSSSDYDVMSLDFNKAPSTLSQSQPPTYNNNYNGYGTTKSPWNMWPTTGVTNNPGLSLASVHGGLSAHQQYQYSHGDLQASLVPSVTPSSPSEAAPLHHSFYPNTFYPATAATAAGFNQHQHSSGAMATASPSFLPSPYYYSPYLQPVQPGGRARVEYPLPSRGNREETYYAGFLPSPNYYSMPVPNYRAPATDTNTGRPADRGGGSEVDPQQRARLWRIAEENEEPTPPKLLGNGAKPILVTATQSPSVIGEADFRERGLTQFWENLATRIPKIAEAVLQMGSGAHAAWTSTTRRPPSSMRRGAGGGAKEKTDEGDGDPEFLLPGPTRSLPWTHHSGGSAASIQSLLPTTATSASPSPGADGKVVDQTRGVASVINSMPDPRSLFTYNRLFSSIRKSTTNSVTSQQQRSVSSPPPGASVANGNGPTDREQQEILSRASRELIPKSNSKLETSGSPAPTSAKQSNGRAQSLGNNEGWPERLGTSEHSKVHLSGWPAGENTDGADANDGEEIPGRPILKSDGDLAEPNHRAVSTAAPKRKLLRTTITTTHPPRPILYTAPPTNVETLNPQLVVGATPPMPTAVGSTSPSPSSSSLIMSWLRPFLSGAGGEKPNPMFSLLFPSGANGSSNRAFNRTTQSESVSSRTPTPMLPENLFGSFLPGARSSGSGGGNGQMSSIDSWLHSFLPLPNNVEGSSAQEGNALAQMFAAALGGGRNGGGVVKGGSNGGSTSSLFGGSIPFGLDKFLLGSGLDDDGGAVSTMGEKKWRNSNFH